MTGHLLFTAWDDRNPATQSRFVVEEIIRRRIGFDGLLLTDDIDMEALSGSVPDRVDAALAAGCDVALNCWAKMDDMVEIARRHPVMPRRSAERLERALAQIGDPGDVKRQADLLAKRDALLALAEARA
jgi:beta-N-acetylhexosaminidase